MSVEALPCLVCGKPLKNVSHRIENQPYDAIAFRSHGAYGSTVFDPGNGEFIEFNICDQCLTKAGEQGRVITSRTSIPVWVERSIWGSYQVDRPYVPWNADLQAEEERMNLDCTEVMQYADDPKFRWNAGDKGTLQAWVDGEIERLGLTP